MAPSPALASGFYASSMEIITLANILASCINSDGTTICQQLFTLVTPPQGTAPTDTITAALDILKFPSNNTAAIFALMSANSPFQPALTVAPALWTLPILHITVTPAISPAACTYAIAPQITISDSTPGSVIFYTLDGSVPTTTSSLYMSPFNLPGTLSTSQTVRAIAVAANFAGSASVSAKYIIPAAGTITNLVFVQQPQTTVIGTILPNIRIQFVDSYGNLVRNGSAGVYLSLQNNPTGATLGSSTGVSAGSNGVADFNSITVDKLGVGYTLLAIWYGGATAVSTPFDITQAGITLTTPSPMIGAGSTQPGTFKLALPAPAGGVTVNFSSNNPGAVSVAPATVSVNAGDTTGSFTYTSAGPGLATLRASATGYLDGTVDETTSANFVSLGILPAFTIDSTSPLTLSLSTPAPQGGITVSLVSSNPAVASITPAAVTFPTDATTTTVAPQVVTKAFGSTQLLATAPGYMPDAKTVLLSGSASLTATLSLAPFRNATDTLTLSQPAPAGGVTFTISSDKNTVAYPGVTSVIVPAGAAVATFTVNSSSVGTANIHADSPGFPQATTAVTGAGTISIGTTINNYPAAKLYIPNTVTLSAAPSAPTGVTITSSNPALLLLSADATRVGTPSITLMTTGGTTTPVFYEQGQLAGNVNITVTAANFTTLVQPVTVNQTTLVLQPLIVNSTLASTDPVGEIDVALAEVTPGNTLFALCAFGGNSGNGLGCKLNPGVTLSVDAASSNAAVVTFTSTTVTLVSGSQIAMDHLQPVAAGTTTLSVGTQATGLVTVQTY